MFKGHPALQAVRDGLARKLREARALYRARRGFVRFENPRDSRSYRVISRDTHPGGKWRVTYIDQLGPAGHECYPTFSAALRATVSGSIAVAA